MNIWTPPGSAGETPCCGGLRTQTWPLRNPEKPTPGWRMGDLIGRNGGGHVLKNVNMCKPLIHQLLDEIKWFSKWPESVFGTLNLDRCRSLGPWSLSVAHGDGGWWLATGLMDFAGWWVREGLQHGHECMWERSLVTGTWVWAIMGAIFLGQGPGVPKVGWLSAPKVSHCHLWFVDRDLLTKPCLREIYAWWLASRGNPGWCV